MNLYLFNEKELSIGEPKFRQEEYGFYYEEINQTTGEIYYGIGLTMDDAIINENIYKWNQLISDCEQDETRLIETLSKIRSIKRFYKEQKRMWEAKQ